MNFHVCMCLHPNHRTPHPGWGADQDVFAFVQLLTPDFPVRISGFSSDKTTTDNTSVSSSSSASASASDSQADAAAGKAGKAELTPKCPSGHAMPISDYAEGAYKGGWYCDLCRQVRGAVCLFVCMCVCVCVFVFV